MYGVKLYGVFSMPVYREFVTRKQAEVFIPYWKRECPHVDVEVFEPAKEQQK